MSEAFSRGPEPDTSRVPRREGQSQAPQVAPHVQRVINDNPALQRAIQAQEAKGPPPPPEPERPPDPAVELIRPLEEMPKWEAERIFKLARAVPRPGYGDIREVRMRTPNGLDVFEIGGLPTRTQWTQTGMTIEMDADRFKRWVQRLAVGVDIATLYTIPARDMRAIYEWLNNELNQAGN
jgi:hypothetical protein